MPVTLNNSSVSGNSTSGNFANGGGMFLMAEDVTLFQSTVSGNFTTGALRERRRHLCFFSDSTGTLTRSTLVDNHALGAAQGGGLMFRYGTTGFNIESSIIAINSAGGVSSNVWNLSGSLPIKYSLVGDNTGFVLGEAPVGAPDANGNLIGGPVHGLIDPLLAPLADNGGFELPDGSRILTHRAVAGESCDQCGGFECGGG